MPLEEPRAVFSDFPSSIEENTQKVMESLTQADWKQMLEALRSLYEPHSLAKIAQRAKNVHLTLLIVKPDG